jgi:hypothetical protein
MSTLPGMPITAGLKSVTGEGSMAVSGLFLWGSPVANKTNNLATIIFSLRFSVESHGTPEIIWYSS